MLSQSWVTYDSKLTRISIEWPELSHKSQSNHSGKKLSPVQPWFVLQKCYSARISNQLFVSMSYCRRFWTTDWRMNIEQQWTATLLVRSTAMTIDNWPSLHGCLTAYRPGTGSDRRATSSGRRPGQLSHEAAALFFPNPPPSGTSLLWDVGGTWCRFHFAPIFVVRLVKMQFLGVLLGGRIITIIKFSH